MKLIFPITLLVSVIVPELLCSTPINITNINGIKLTQVQMKTNYIDSAFNVVKQFEGFSAVEYKCTAKQKTIGYGLQVCHIKKYQNKISPEKAEILAKEYIKSDIIDKLDSNIFNKLTFNQKVVIVSFIYNIGITQYNNSTIRMLIDEGIQEKGFLNDCDIKLIKKELKKWDIVKGKKTSHLTKRREYEISLLGK